MKKLSLLIALLFFSIQIFPQDESEWKYEEKGNSFDGRYRRAYQIDDFGKWAAEVDPKNLSSIKKFLTIVKWDNPAYPAIISLNGDFLDIDKSNNSDNLLIQFYFDEESFIYSSDQLSIYDNEIIIKSFNHPRDSDPNKLLYNLEIISLLRKYSKVTFRITQNEQRVGTDLVFNLKGSSKAINFVLPELDSLIAKERLRISTREKIRNNLLKKLEGKLPQHLIEKVKYRLDRSMCIGSGVTTQWYSPFAAQKITRIIKDLIIEPTQVKNAPSNATDVIFIYEDGTVDRLDYTGNETLNISDSDSYLQKYNF